MVTTKSKRSKILKKLKGEKKRQQLFMLPVDLIEAFKTDCKKQGVQMSHVLEELIKEYLGGNNDK